MSDADKASKTEKPTGKRLDEAFKEGNFPQAQEIGVVFTLMAGFMAISASGQKMVMDVFELSKSVFGNLGTIEFGPDGMDYWAARCFTKVSVLAAPILGATMTAGILAGGLQSGFKLTPKAMGLKFEKLNPVTGAKRLFSKDVFVRFGIDMLKMAAMSVIMYGVVMKIVDDPIFYTPVNINHIGTFITDTLMYVLWRLVLAIGVIAAISYFYQKTKNTNDLKMTKEEVKQETKDADMSPEVRKARMSMAMRLMQKQMLSEVPTADVVVTNPTHYAVALKYERGLDAAPMVLAKGENAFALRIKELARENGVPIVENKLVARMLYKASAVGHSIPAEMFQSVAEILAFVYRTHRYYFHRLKGRRAARRNA